LRRVAAPFHFGGDGRFPLRGAGVGVPTLREVLGRYPDHRVIIEMKDDDPALGEAVARVVREAGAVDRVCGSGFGVRATRAARLALPEMAAGGHSGAVRLWRVRCRACL